MKKLLFSLAIMAGFVSINAQTVLFEDDFESYTAEPNTGEGTQIPDGYTSYDVNGDGYNWGLSNPSFWTQPMGDIYTGNYMISATFLQTGESIQAENILVLPQISIPAGSTNVNLSYYVGSGTDTGFFAEKYEVIVTTENSQAAILAATPVFSETLPSQGGFNRTVNLDDFAGQDVYISFYHTDSFDKWILGLDDISVTVDGGGEPTEYCEIITLDCAIEKIDGVTFAGIENVGTGCGTAETNDFTDMVANVQQGQMYTMTLDIEADPAFPDDNAYFFIDWNQNGTLDDAGEVYEVIMHTGTSGQYTLDVTVPADAVVGNTRLRVGIAYNSGPDFVPIACPTEDNVTFGEYEDYTVNVSEGGEPTEYCEIITLDCAIEKIDGVTFAGIENVGTGCGTAETNDFTDMVANVQQGEMYTMTLDIEADPAFPDDNAYFFIDWNQNGTLDDAGEVYEVIMHTGTSGQYTLDVTVPADAVLGNTRLRVGIAYNSGPDFVPIACPTEDNVTFGEYEDYTVNVSEGGSTGEECNQEVLSNGLENGLFLGGADNQRLAVDVTVAANRRMTISAIEPTIIVPEGSEATTFSFIFYEDEAGLPGTEVDNVTGTITSSTVTGQNFGRDFIRYAVNLDAPVILEAGTYWMEMTSDAEGWEATTASVLGSTLVFNNASTSGAWINDGTGTELVYEIVATCETLGADDMASFDFAYYPNPVKDVLNITSNKTVENVSVYNLAGQQVLANAKVSNGQINVSALSSGVYVFRATLQGGQVETFKIIKK